MTDDVIDGRPEDPSECFHCGAEREGHSHLHVYGDWDPEQDGFTRRPAMEPLCQNCWQKRYNRVAGAYWESTMGTRSGTSSRRVRAVLSPISSTCSSAVGRSFASSTANYGA